MRTSDKNVFGVGGWSERCSVFLDVNTRIVRDGRVKLGSEKPSDRVNKSTIQTNVM